MKAKTFEPKFERVKDIRCEDCEYNGYLTNDGFPRKGANVGKCSNCSSGRITLLTWEMIRQMTPKALERVITPNGLKKGYRLALRSELVDPYAIGKKG